MQSQPLAYLMPEFLESDDARPIRILAGVPRAAAALPDQNIQDTVVFFGSARVHSRESRAARARRCARAASATPTTDEQELRSAQGGRVVALLRGRARSSRSC